MKRIITFLFATGLSCLLATGCQEEYKTYPKGEYVLFPDPFRSTWCSRTRSTSRFPSPRPAPATTTARSAWRSSTRGSTAIEGLHYRLASNTITIPAGQRSTEVLVHGNYENFEPSDTLQFTLRLVMPEQLKWDLYQDQTRVRMLKGCTFHIEDFTGWCVVTSTFLQSYPGVENTSIQRLIYTEADPTDRKRSSCTTGSSRAMT